MEMQRAEGSAARSILRTGAALLAIAFLGLAFGAEALPLAPTTSWDAASPGASPGTTWAAQGAGADWAVSGATHVTGTSSLPGLGAAYAFDGADDGLLGPSLQTQGAATGLRTSFEIWFRPTDLSGGPQVLFETGGWIDGLSVTLDDASLLFRVQDDRTNVASLGFDLGSVGIGEFIQVVGVVDLGTSAELFVNGLSVGTTSAAGILDWSGGGSAGVGNANGRVGGTNGPGEGDLFGFGAFAGEIAQLHYYEDAVLSAGQVAEHYGVVAVPDPNTALLLSSGLLGLAARRRPAA